MKELKVIKIFFASSTTEFAHDRQELKAFIGAINDIYLQRGIYLRFDICEYVSNAVADKRKQDEYNQLIRDSQFFYVILGKKVGEYTAEEFEIALDSFKKKQTPKIYTYFKQLPDKEIEQSVLDLKKRLEDLEHFYTYFSHFDTIKLNILLELTRADDVNVSVSLEEGMLKLEGQSMLSMKNIPIYSKNEAVQRLLKEKEELEGEFATLTKMAASMHDDPTYIRMQLKNSEKRNAITEQLHTLETDILGLCRLANEKRSMAQHLNWREKKALSFIDEGNYEAAKNLLRDRTWKQEVANAEETVDLAMEPIREYISGQKTLIDTIKTGGITEDSAEEIEAIYEEIIALCEKYNIMLTTLYDFADFLEGQNKYTKAVGIAERLKHYYDSPNAQVSMLEKGGLLNLLGILYYRLHRFPKGDTAYREALKISRRLAADNSAAFMPCVAETCNNLAILLKNQNSPVEAEKLYREALDIRRNLAKANPDAFMPDVAMTCNNLAILLYGKQNFTESRALFEEALDIYSRFPQYADRAERIRQILEQFFND